MVIKGGLLDPMPNAHEFRKALAMVLCVAAVTTVLFQKLKQPVVLGYILAGLIIGPHVPIPLVANPQIIQTLSELGVILLMFSLGLEFSLGKLLKIGAGAAITAVVQCSLMVLVSTSVPRRSILDNFQLVLRRGLVRDRSIKSSKLAEHPRLSR